MKKGFTLLELIVVIIIVGVLATLGLTQYGSMVEKMRRAEAIQVLADIRKLAYTYWLANGSMTALTDADVNIGEGQDQIPRYCRPSHYFQYQIVPGYPSACVALATRCTSGGKNPQWSELYLIEMIVVMTNGSTTWQYEDSKGWGPVGPYPP